MSVTVEETMVLGRGLTQEIDGGMVSFCTVAMNVMSLDVAINPSELSIWK